MQFQTEFTEEWCRKKAAELPTMFASGQDVVTVCLRLEMSKKTFYRLCEKHSFWADAYEIGKMYSESFWTRVCFKAATGVKDKDGERYAGNPYILNKIMNNKFNWYDKKEEIKEVVEKVTEKNVDKELLKKVKDELDA